jgi:hypothetical protein
LIQLLTIRNLRVANLFSSWQHGCILIMPEAEVGLASKSAAWCCKSKSRGIASRSISETRQKSLGQVSHSWTTRRDEKRRPEKPFADLDPDWGKGVVDGNQWVQIVYLTL